MVDDRGTRPERLLLSSNRPGHHRRLTPQEIQQFVSNLPFPVPAPACSGAPMVCNICGGTTVCWANICPLHATTGGHPQAQPTQKKAPGSIQVTLPSWAEYCHTIASDNIVTDRGTTSPKINYARMSKPSKRTRTPSSDANDSFISAKQKDYHPNEQHLPSDPLDATACGVLMTQADD